jgi:hypothetical protein
MNPVTDILVRARKLIEKPENWTQEHYARNVAGEQTSTQAADAVCWCAIGAVLRADDTYPYSEAVGIASDLLRDAMGMHPADFNDSHTHPEVLAAFDRAIEASGNGEDA